MDGQRRLLEQKNMPVKEYITCTGNSRLKELGKRFEATTLKAG